MSIPRREQRGMTHHAQAGHESTAVVYDVDGLLRFASLRRQLGRLRALLHSGPDDRRSLLGMPRVLQVLANAAPDTSVFYLSALPNPLRRPVSGFLRRDGYPSGTTLLCGRALPGGWVLGAGLERKQATLDSLFTRRPNRRWVLVGDDVGHDPTLFAYLLRRHRGQVAAVALHRLLDDDRADTGDLAAAAAAARVPVVEAPNGEEMSPLLAAALGLHRTPQEPAVDDWFLTSTERGNNATRLRDWTVGNIAQPLLHGSSYFRAVADTLGAAGLGDTVLIAGWRVDGDELLIDGGPTVAEVVEGAARRGASVRGLLWRSHLARFGYQLEQNRTFARGVAAAGGEILLDQRIRVIGSHHQKLVVVRHGRDPDDDVAFVGGIDLDHGSRDDAAHRGDPQPVEADDEYGPTPARHDLQVALRGPAVGDLDHVFRERWDDPTALVRMPWHVLSDRMRGLRRTATPLPAPPNDPPAAGTCAVQVLRTYPRRRPPYPFAPDGERSVARAYLKALSRAQRLVYIEDQYLWSFDIARAFAAALRRAPRLHLIVIVPFRPDEKGQTAPAAIGQGAAIAMVREAGGERVQILQVENHAGRPVYVHDKLCIVDDVWAMVGSSNLNNRSWTHDSELSVAILDDARDTRAPADPGGLGDGARRFARELRLALMREHLALGHADSPDLRDPDRATDTVRRRAAALDAWHARGQRGPRPPGRLRRHLPSVAPDRLSARQRWLVVPGYRLFLDPDGRPLGMRLRRTY